MSRANWNRVQDLFLQASELPAGIRTAFLNEHCAGDDEARREVESLLAAECEADEQLRAIVTAAALEVQTLHAEQAVGRRIGPYVVEKEIGRGGMGTVYLAFRDDDQFRQQVAIKLVNRGMDSEFALSRFRRERQVLADLQHPNIARLLDGGATADGMPFFAMEYLEGEPMTVYCRRRRLGQTACLELFLSVCSAVAYAHHMLVIHRDLKPGNTLVGKDGIPKLLDFGVATILDEHCEPRGALSPLTAKYASPEQLKGAPLTTATDVYSLGAILGELLQNTGEPPAGDLEAIVHMAMQPDPDRRYGSVNEMAADIRRYLKSWPVQAQPASFRYRVRKLVRRRRFPLMAAAAVVCALLIGMGEAVHQARQAESARRIAEANRDAAQKARQTAEDRLNQMLDLSGRGLSDVAALMERLPGALPARRELVGAMLSFLEKLSKDTGTEIAPRIALAKAYLRLGELQAGSDAANLGDFPGALRSLRAGAALLDGLPPATLAQKGGLGVWLDLKQTTAGLLVTARDRAGAIAVLRDALAASREAPTADRALERSKANLYLSLARADTDDYGQSLEDGVSYQHMLESLLVRFPGDPDLRYDLSAAHTLIGFDFIHLGAPEKAVEHYRQSMQLREQLVVEHPNDGVYRRALMLSYQHFAGLQGSPLVPNMGNPEVARAYYRKALPIAEGAATDTQNLRASGDYAGLLMRSGALDVPPAGLPESLATLRRAAALLESLEASGGRDIYLPQEGTARLYMGHRLLALGDRNEALNQYQRAAAITQEILLKFPQEPDMIRQESEAQWGMVRAFALLKNRAAAFDHAGKMMRSASGEASIARAYLALAQAHRAFEEQTAAREAAQRAIEHATPLLTGRTWDPLLSMITEAKAIADPRP